MAKKIIHIFIGSSIVEFEMERLQLTEFIRNLSDRFEDAYDIKIKPIICENVDTNVPRSGGKQDEYNDLIRASEMCFFIFFTRAGKFTCEEFEVAYKFLKDSGKPKVYVYFKNIPEGQPVDPSIGVMKNRVDNEIQHFHGTFDDIDTIKLRILLNLKLQEMDFLEVKYKDGKCYAGGREVEHLDISKVSEFKNNSILKDLRAEFAEVEKEYFPLKARYEEKKGDSEFYKKYSDIAAKRANLLKLIEETEKEIFSLSMNMCKNAVHGEITARQAAAYELFEKGDLYGANKILDFAEIKSEYLRKKAVLEAEIKKLNIRYIRELKTKIEILTAMTDYPDRFAQIEEIYEEITPIAESSLVETDVLFDYAEYLRVQNQLNKSAEIYTRIEKLFANNSELATDENLAWLYYGAGILYYNLLNYKKSEECYLKAMAIYKELADKNPSGYKSNLASNYINVGILYYVLREYQKSKEYYLKAIAILEELSNSTYNPSLANSYNCLGVLYSFFNNYKLSKQYYLKAIVIYEKLANENLDYNRYFAACYSNVGNLYLRLRDYKKSEEYQLKAIAIYEKLAKENSSAYNPDLALSYNNAGGLYGNLHDYKKSEEYYLKAIAIREELAKQIPSAYNPSLASSYNNVCEIFYELQEYKKCEEYRLKEIEIRKEIASENVPEHNYFLAVSYRDIGILYNDNLCNKAKALEFYLKAIIVCEQILLQNPKFFISLKPLHDIYEWVGDIYEEMGESEKAEEYRGKAVRLKSQDFALNLGSLRDS